MRGVGRALELFATGMEEGRHPPTPMTHHQRPNPHVLRVPPCGFRDFWGIAVRTPGWGRLRGRRPSPSLVRFPAYSSKSHGAMWLLSVPCVLPFQVA